MPSDSTFPSVLAFVRSPEVIGALRLAVRGRASLVRFDCLAAARGELDRAADVCLAVIEVGDGTGRGAIPAIQRVHERHPDAKIVVVCADPRRLSIYDAFGAGRAGASALVGGHLGGFGEVIDEVLETQVRDAAVESASAAIAATVPCTVRGVVVFTLTHARRPITVDEVAASLRQNRKTLYARLRRAGMPNLSELISWSRLVQVGVALEVKTTSVERIAASLGFESASSVFHLVRRYARCTPKQLRDSGALRSIVSRFIDRLSSSR